MKYLFIITLGLIFLAAGCSEVVNIAGIFINRLNIQEPGSKVIIVSVKNADSIFIPNFEITVKENYGNKCITGSRFSNFQYPVIINLPDEQINTIPPEAAALIFSIYHPLTGELMQEVLIDKFNSGEVFEVNFVLSLKPDEVKRFPILKYKGCY
jgi:hypothetical protein